MDTSVRRDGCRRTGPFVRLAWARRGIWPWWCGGASRLRGRGRLLAFRWRVCVMWGGRAGWSRGRGVGWRGLGLGGGRGCRLGLRGGGRRGGGVGCGGERGGGALASLGSGLKVLWREGWVFVEGFASLEIHLCRCHVGGSIGKITKNYRARGIDAYSSERLE